MAFLCYSRFQVDPGVWPLQKTSYTIHHTASDLVGMGYWSPYAERSTPTATELPGGYYLICNLPAGMRPVVGTLPKHATPRAELVTRKGALVPMSREGRRGAGAVLAGRLTVVSPSVGLRKRLGTQHRSPTGCLARA